MSGTISQLEQDWLAAETMADQLKNEATHADAVLAKAPETGPNGITIGDVEELRARYAAAEEAAREAFDRLWIAKEQG